MLAIYMAWAILLASSGLLLFFAWNQFRQQYTPLALSIASSLRGSPSKWEYPGSNGWLRHDDALIDLDLDYRGHFSGKVIASQAVNRGTRDIRELSGKDRRLVDNALSEWKRLTAAEREEIAAFREKKAIRALTIRGVTSL